MSNKFSPAYKLTWISKESGETLNFALPFTVQFSISRSTMASLNSSQFKLYNLNRQTRSKLFQDRYDMSITKRKQLVFQAGYETLSTLFIGDVFEAFSSRQGTEILTLMDCVDGAIDTGETLTNKTIQKDTDIKNVLTGLISEFSTLTEGSIGTIDGTIKRPVTLEGNTFDLIKTYSNNQAFIDLGKVNILKDTETIPGSLLSITSETGLLNVPRRRGGLIEIDTIFEPRITIGQILEIHSKIQPEYDGQYKVVGLNHTGIISPVVCGDRKSKFTLLIGSKSASGSFTNV